ncbi:MAG: hypothetical protein ABIO79_04945 [Ferruginibacter sp.]
MEIINSIFKQLSGFSQLQTDLISIERKTPDEMLPSGKAWKMYCER